MPGSLESDASDLRARAARRPQPAVAAIRAAVRRELADLSANDVVLVACSGGPDSLALADALAYQAQRAQLRAGAIVVDHQLSAEASRASEVAAQQCARIGLNPVELIPVTVAATGSGVEAAARDCRYRAYEQAAQQHRAAAVLLGHTEDDQAEQVLLGVLRGSGARSLAGMPARRGRYRRPLLGITREQTLAACVAEGLTAWADPMNEDQAYTRVRARRLLAELSEQIGPGIRSGLARTAELLRVDADYLDSLAQDDLETLPVNHDGAGADVAVADLAVLPTARRTRVWRMLLGGLGAAEVTSTHVASCDRLLTHWRGQGPVDVPGGIQVMRHRAMIEVRNQASAPPSG